VLARFRVRSPVASGISKWVYRQTSQKVCPWNARFSKELPEDSPFKSRGVLANKDARRLALHLLAMTHEELSAAFKGSPKKRAKLRGLKRNAAVVLTRLRGDAGPQTRCGARRARPISSSP